MTDLVEKKGNAPVQSDGPMSITDVIRGAVDANVSPESLMQLLDFQRELEADAARKAFTAAFSAFQSEMPTVPRTKGIPDRNGNVRYRYAPLEDIERLAKPVLARHGLTARFLTETAEGGLTTITCVVQHVDGHEQLTPVTMPTKTEVPQANAAQQTGASLTYGKRLAYCNALGIMTGESDTDGVEPQTFVPLTEAHAVELMELADAMDIDEQGLLKGLGAIAGNAHLGSLEEFPDALFNKAKARLEKRRKSQ